MYPEKVMKALQRAKADLAAGDPGAAIADLQKAVKKFPKGFECWLLYGQAKGQLGDHAGAETCFRKAIAIEPRDLNGWNCLGLSYTSRRMYKQAADAFSKAIGCDPQAHPDVYHNLGSAQLEQGQYQQAAKTYEYTVQRKDTRDVWSLLAMAYKGLDRYDDALAANLKAVQRGAKGYTISLNLGICYHVLGDYENAAAHAQLALDAKPGDAVAFYNLGLARMNTGAVPEALAALSRSTLPAAASTRLLALNYIDPADPIRVRTEHEAEMARLTGAIVPRTLEKKREPGQRLRVGFVSADFREHPVAFFIEGMLAKLDREQIEVFFYSGVRKADHVTARLEALGEHWRTIFNVADDEFSALADRDGIHVMVDLAGHTNGSRIAAFARRLAPVQASYLGYSATTGLREMDFLLTDEVLAPDAQAESHYTEQLVRLGPVVASYTPPPQDVAVSPLPLIAKGYPTFASFSQQAKISPATVQLWIDALKAVPQAKMLVMTKGLGVPAAQQRFLAPFVAQGIDAGRFELRESGTMAEYLQAHHAVDLILDSTPWSGHTTTLHALWMGVPTLSLKGIHHTSRFGEMVLRAAGLDRYLVADRSEFGARALALVTDQAQLQADRLGMRDRLAASPLFDHQAMARRFERACMAMWKAGAATP